MSFVAFIESLLCQWKEYSWEQLHAMFTDSSISIRSFTKSYILYALAQENTDQLSRWEWWMMQWWGRSKQSLVISKKFQSIICLSNCSKMVSPEVAVEYVLDKFDHWIVRESEDHHQKASWHKWVKLRRQYIFLPHPPKFSYFIWTNVRVSVLPTFYRMYCGAVCVWKMWWWGARKIK